MSAKDGGKEIEEKIIQDDQNKWNRKATSQQLLVSDPGMLEVSNGNGEGERYSLSDLATAQMCQRLDIPVAYYKRLPEEMKTLWR